MNHAGLQPSHQHDDPAGRGPLLAIAALVLVALAAVAAVRLSGMDIRTTDAPPLAVRSLNFVDAPDGSILVKDARTGESVEQLRGEHGFVRGTLRGLARERRRQGIGQEPPFELVARSDGRLTLIDPSTGRRVDLESFGPANARHFAQLLGPVPAASR